MRAIPLQSRAGLDRQSLVGTRLLEGPGGLYVAPVAHEGNQSRSLEEVEAVAAIVDGLLTPTAKWVTRGGEERPLRADDILIVAPYNAQVDALAQRLPGMRVGTVDKFQGQEAPVVIYSMASSSAEDAPRGLGFLYDPHRTNVATSRARVACVLVASPMVFEPECRSPEQMRWANGLCLYREMATEIEVLPSRPL